MYVLIKEKCYKDNIKLCLMVELEFTFERCNIIVFRNIVSILFEKNTNL